MIVQCENCGSRFNLDESFLKEGGSKVRCSQCRKVFVVFPPTEDPVPYQEEQGRDQDGPAETVILDSPPDLNEVSADQRSSDPDLFTAAFPGESEDEPDGDYSTDFDGGPGEEKEDDFSATHMEAAFDGASGDGEEIFGRDAERNKGRAEPDGEPLFSVPHAALERRRSILLPLLLGLLLLFGAGFGVYHLLASGKIQEAVTFLKPRPDRAQVDPGVRRLSFEGVKGSFVLTEDGKQRFVIRGAIVNNYSEPRSFISIKASILDGQGRTVSSKTVYAGNYFSQGDLVGRPIEFLEERLDRSRGEEDGNVAVPAGGKVPFMVVFQDLPRDISEFTVEGVSSSQADRAEGP